MNSKEIKQTMSEGWHLDMYNTNVYNSDGGKICSTVSNETMPTTHAPNGMAIVAAIRNTYLAGIDPLLVPKMLQFLEGLQYEMKLYEHERYTISEFIKS